MRGLGLTALYNQVNDAGSNNPEIRQLRDIHAEIDLATAEAYGWSDIPLEHGFHETRQGVRFTVSPLARAELLDRLLDLNHQRHTEELAAGLVAADVSGTLALMELVEP